MELIKAMDIMLLECFLFIEQNNILPILVTCGISIGISFCFCSFYYNKYKQIQKDLDTKYIKIDVRVKDAFYEAYQWAKKNHNDFEAKTFFNLLKETNIKERL